MSKVFLTCDLNNLSIVNGAPVCSEWEYMTPMFPMFELTLPELSAVMGATALFFGNLLQRARIAQTTFIAR